MKDDLTVSISGIEDVLQMLEEMKKTTARGVLKRIMAQAAQPMAVHASALAPKLTGALSSSIVVASSFESSTGKSTYAAVMKAGGTAKQAASAMRAYRSQFSSTDNMVHIFVGPAAAKNKRDAIKAIVQEFGSIKQAARPYMRPAFDAEKNSVLPYVRDNLLKEVEATIARSARRAALKAQRLA